MSLVPRCLSSWGQSIKDWTYRHRRKFYFLGGTTLVFYCGYRFYVVPKIREFERELQKQRERKLFKEIQITCQKATRDYLDSLEVELSRIVKGPELKDIKDKEEKKQQLQQNKVPYFVRQFTSIYALSLLVVYLRVQLNVVSRARPSNGSGRYLLEATQVLHNGVQKLSQTVNEICQRFLNDLPLSKKLSTQDVKNLIHDVVSAVGRTDLRQFVLCLNPSIENQELFQKTNKWVNDPRFLEVLGSVIDTSFNIFQTTLIKIIESRATSNPQVTEPSEILLVNLVAIIAPEYRSMQKYLPDLFQLSQLDEFAYEIFTSNF